MDGENYYRAYFDRKILPKYDDNIEICFVDVILNDKYQNTFCT